MARLVLRGLAVVSFGTIGVLGQPRPAAASCGAGTCMPGTYCPSPAMQVLFCSNHGCETENVFCSVHFLCGSNMTLQWCGEPIDQ